jgi:hypothetical protein
MNKVAKIFLATAVIALSGTAFFGCSNDNTPDNGGDEQHVHEWDTSNVTWEWQGTTKATATFVCKSDSSHKENVEATQIADQVTNATCTTDGVTAYTAKVTFNGTEYSNTKQVTISATGHNYDINSIVWTWDGTTAATATVTCANDSTHTQNYTATVTSAVKTEATCDTDGVRSFEASVDIGGVTYTNVSATTDVITASNHSYNMNNIVWTWNGTTAATATVTCSTDANHTKSFTATVESKLLSQATCTVDGKTGYVATVMVDGKTYTNTSSVTQTIKATGHTTSLDEKLSKDATCTERGADVYKCSKCDYTETVVKNIIDHNWDVEEATCTQAKTCSVCGTTIPALGHKYESVSSDATMAADADDSDVPNCAEGIVHTYICSRCDDTYEEIEVEPKDHVVDEWVVNSQDEPELKEGETCVYIQIYKGVCKVCGDQSATKEVEFTKHDYTATITTAPTCTTKGVMTYQCKACKSSYTADYAIVDDAHKWVESGKVGDTVSYTCDYNSQHTKKVLVANEKTETTVSQGDLTNAGEIALKEASIALDDKTLSGLSETEGDISIGASSNSVEDLGLGLSKTQKEQIGENPVYNLSMEVDNTPVSSFRGLVTVKVPYTLADGEDPETIAVWYIDENGNVIPIQATYITENGEGYAVFQTSHFSYYTVTRLTPAERCELYGHSWVEVDVNTIICTSEAYTLKTCRRCGEKVRNVYRTATEHVYGETTKVAATCTETGSETKTCKECGYVSTVKLPILGHAWVQDTEKSTAATCQKAGSSLYVCSNDAEHYYTKAIAQKAHNYKKEVIAPTCEAQGYTTYTCSYGCGDHYTEDVKEALGHNYSSTYYVHTSTTKGYTVYVCENDETHTYTVTDETLAHEWNLSNATCVDDKTCTVCGTVGEQKTGNHTMVNGACTVCGESPCKGNHTFAESDDKLDATCTENGYTTETCSTCGYKKKTVIPALGHDGKFVCSVCGEALIDKDIFANTYTSLANNQYSLVLKDLAISIDFTTSSNNNVYDAIDYNIELAELTVSFDENGKLYATGYGKLKGFINDMPVDYTSEAVVVLKNNYVYVDIYILGTGGTTSGYNKTSGTDMKSEELMVYSLDEIAEMTGGMSSSILDNAMAILDWVNSDIAPIMKKAAEINKADASNVMLKFAETFLNMEKTKTGYTLTIDWQGIATLNDNLYEHTLAENIDILYGEGAYKAMSDEMVQLLTMPMGDLLSLLAKKGYDVDEFVVAADKLIKVMFSSEETEEGSGNATAQTPNTAEGDTTIKPITSLQDLYDSFEIGKMLKSYFNSDTDITLSDLLNKDGKVNTRSVLDYVNMVLALKGYETEITAENISATLAYAGEMNAYSTVTSLLNNYMGLTLTTAQAKAVVDKVLEIAPEYVTISTKLDNNGAFLSASVDVSKFSAMIGSYYSATFAGNVSVIANYESDVKYDSYIKNITTIADSIKFDRAFADSLYGTNYVDKATLKDGETTDKVIIEFYESGAIKSIDAPYSKEYVYNTRYNNSTVSKYIEIETGRIVSTYSEQPDLEIIQDCGNWYAVSIQALTCKYTYSYKQILRTYKNGTTTDKIITDSSATVGPYERSTSTTYFYNLLTKKVLSSESGVYLGTESSDTKHEYYEDKSAEVVAKGHEDWGEKHYVCVNCGETYVYYYRNGHDDVTINTTFLTDSNLCTDGVTISWYCNTCQKAYKTETYYSHYAIEEIVDISEWIPAACTNDEPLYLYRKYCACGYINDTVGVGGNYNYQYTSYYTQTYTCSDNCGLIISDTSTATTDTDEPCYKITTHTFVIYNGNQTMASKEIIAHNQSHTVYSYAKLTGKTCSNGVSVTNKCIICGKVVSSYTTTGHVNAVLWEYDLSEYGSCGEKIIIVGDPCNSSYDGEYRQSALYYIYDDAGVEKDWGGCPIGHKTAGNDGTKFNYDGDIYECPVDDCNLVVNIFGKVQSDCTTVWTIKVLKTDKTTVIATLVDDLVAGKDHDYSQTGYYTGADNECDYVSIWTCDRCGDTYSQNNKNHEWTWTTIKESTCTQYGKYRWACTRCGEYSSNNSEQPYGHSFNEYADNDSNIYYKCRRCGLISTKGTNDVEVLLEDVTGKVSGEDVNSDMFVVGYALRNYYMEEANYDFWYDAVVTIVIHLEDSSEDVAVIDVDVSRVLEDRGNYVAFSKSEAKQLAQQYIAQMAEEDENYINASYEIRLSFVSADNKTNYDYSITFD